MSQSETGSNGYEEELNIPANSKTWALLSDGLVSYL